MTLKTWDGGLEDAVDAHKNGALKNAVRDAKKSLIPETYIKRVLDYAKQGTQALSFQLTILTGIQKHMHQYLVRTQITQLELLMFLDAVKNDENWDLKNRVNGETARTIRARKLWEDVGHAAWACADPGIQFHDTVNAWHTCPEDGEIRGSNPCSEYMFLDDTACNLASMNLLKFLSKGEFKVDDYIHATKLWTVTLEISVLMAQFPSKEIAQRSYDFRTLGLGYANIGGLLMNMGLGYDSDEEDHYAESDSNYDRCRLLYKCDNGGRGRAFPGYSKNRNHMLRVIRNHRNAARGKDSGYESLRVNQFH